MVTVRARRGRRLGFRSRMGHSKSLSGHLTLMGRMSIFREPATTRATFWSASMPLRVAIVPSICLALALDLAAGGEAWAQVSPSPLPPTSAEAPQEKKPGVAEQAERSPEELPTTPVLPPIRNERKRF